MKLVSTLLATLFFSITNAQNTETAVYELNTHQKIQSLRLSETNCYEQTAGSFSPIAAVCDSTVCLHLNPLSDYELMVNNTTLIQITSKDIQESLMEEEALPIPFVVAKNSIIREE